MSVLARQSPPVGHSRPRPGRQTQPLSQLQKAQWQAQQTRPHHRMRLVRRKPSPYCRMLWQPVHQNRRILQMDTGFTAPAAAPPKPNRQSQPQCPQCCTERPEPTYAGVGARGGSITCTHAQSHAHTHTRTHMHTHIHTHMHTHSLSLELSLSISHHVRPGSPGCPHPSLPPPPPAPKPQPPPPPIFPALSPGGSPGRCRQGAKSCTDDP